MKKYTALLLTLVSLAALAWASVLTARMLLAPASGLSAPSPKTFPTQDSEQALQRIQALDQVLGQIGRLAQSSAQSSSGPVALAGPALSNPKGAAGQQGAQQAGAAGESKTGGAAPVISLVYRSQDMQRAVVDGRMYAAGDVMPNGVHLLEVGMNQLVVEAGGRRQVWKVPGARILGGAVKPPKEAQDQPKER